MQVNAVFRTRYSEAGTGRALGMGLPPAEMWGTAERDLWKPRRHRGPASCARRRAKRAAARLNMGLREYLKLQARNAEARGGARA